MREGRHGHIGHHEHRGHRENRGPEHDGRKNERFQSAQTFRRGRAIAFLERLETKRSTLLKQLNQPEYDAIKQVISGELKATDTIIQEFIQSFELREAFPEGDNNSNGDEVNNDSN